MSKRANKLGRLTIILFMIFLSHVSTIVVLLFYWLQKDLSTLKENLLVFAFVPLLISIVLLTVLFMQVKRKYVPYIHTLTFFLQKLIKGEVPKWIPHATKDTRELNYMLNKLILQKKQEIAFAEGIGKGDYSIPFLPLSKYDQMGNALIKMRNALKDAEIKKEQKHYRLRQEELAKVNHQLERFLYATSHDMRAPLTTLLGLISLAKRETDADNIRSLAGMMEIPIQKLDCVLKQASVFSRNIHEQIWIEPIFISEFIEQIWQDLKDHKNFSKVSFGIETPNEIILYSDPVRVSHAIKQILKNALDFIDNTKSFSYLKVQTHLSHDVVIIEFKDNGMGIDKNYIDKIFSMFYRASEKSIGPGLGLYIAKEILNKLNSHIQLDSELGMGTNVIIEIKNEKNVFLFNKSVVASNGFENHSKQIAR
ncbi:MAG: HAMP domain-containing histidine kinase [Flammeovirgaceae bacterium]|jgi:signal transduction histidine kinase|nr:HAMP domain-containing histidine kinase [Flammeovirgaceae bacterium]